MPASTDATGAADAVSAQERAFSVSILGGPVGLQRDYGLGFQRELITAVEQLGYRNETTTAVEAAFPDLPTFPADLAPTAAIGVPDLFVGVGLYAALKLSDAVIADIAQRVYEQAVERALSSLWSRLPRTVSNCHRPLQLTATFEHWFDRSRTLVRVVVVTDTASVAPSTRHVRAALLLAQTYVSEHGGHVELTYRVVHDELDEDPTVRPLR